MLGTIINADVCPHYFFAGVMMGLIDADVSFCRDPQEVDRVKKFLKEHVSKDERQRAKAVNFGSQAEVKERNKAGTADRQTRTEGTQECGSGATRSSTSSSDMNCQEAAPLQVTLQKMYAEHRCMDRKTGSYGIKSP